MLCSYSIFWMDVLEARQLLSAGQINASFGTGGHRDLQDYFPAFVEATGAVQSDGKILLGGFGTPNGSLAVVIRLNGDGSLDQSFGDKGETTFSFQSGANFNKVQAMAIQPDGKIVVVGIGQHPNGPDVGGIARLNTTGTLDKTFNGTGINTYNGSGEQQAFTNVKILSSGKIIVGGQAFSKQDYLVGRYNSNGSPDKSFNKTGFESVDMGGDDLLSDVAGTKSGEIIAIGLTGGRFGAIELTSSGSIDRSFGSNGRRFDSGFVSVDAVNFGGGLFMQSDGTFIVAGTSTTKSGTVTQLRDYSANGKATGFGTANVPVNLSALQAATQQMDGKFLLAGTMMVSSNGQNTEQPVVVRVSSSGKLDTTFGKNGIAEFDSSQDGVENILVTPSKEILLGMSYLNTGIPWLYELTDA